MYRGFMGQYPKEPFQLKKPILVYLLGAIFFTAPVINLAYQLYARGIPKWFSPLKWFILFERLPIIEQGLFIATMGAGLLLFFQRRSSWLASILIILFSSIYNLWFQWGLREINLITSIQLISNCSVLLVFYFFRFPYLDQRDHIFGGYKTRVDVDFKIVIDGKIVGKMINISETGCLLKSEASILGFSKSQMIEIKFAEDVDMTLSGIIIRTGESLGIEFKNLHAHQKKFITAIVKGRLKSHKS